MNEIILVIALVMLILASGIHLVRTLRSDGYGKLPPPPSRLEQVRTANGHCSMV